jgi:hypothetical protein
MEVGSPKSEVGTRQGFLNLTGFYYLLLSDTADFR